MRLGRFGAAAGGDGHSSAEVTENRVAGMLWCVLRREVAFQSLQCTLKHNSTAHCETRRLYCMIQIKIFIYNSF